MPIVPLIKHSWFVDSSVFIIIDLFLIFIVLLNLLTQKNMANVYELDL